MNLAIAPSYPMKRWKLLVFRHWRAKLISICAAIALWAAIRYHIGATAPAPLPSESIHAK